MLISEFTPMGAVELRRMDGEAYMTRRAEVLELSANLPEDVTIEQMESIDSEMNLYKAEDEHRANLAALNAEKRQLVINGGGSTVESVATAAVNDSKNQEAPTMPTQQARSLGAHFAEHVKREGHAKSFHIVAPAYARAAADINVSPSGAALQAAITTYDTNIVEGVRESMGVLNLLGREVIEGNTLTFFTEGAMEGTIANSISEGTAKSKVHFADPTPTTVTLEKVAAYIKESDELIDDYGFLASAIDGRLVYELNLKRQGKVIANLLATSGIQTIGATTAVTRTAVKIADEIANAIADVMTQSGRPANAIVMTPDIWKILRIGKNQTNDYYGGGYFEALHSENIWNLPIVLSNQLTANHVVVGAFDTCATLVTKAEGVTVEAVNTDQDDFIKNLMTIRAEVREKLAVRRPAGFVNITVAAS
ncbi:MAG: phage major capsid protein [Atopobiaceae bacterium]|nr:phage major capsid protein [Atopobiaceae bacterium]